MLPDPYPVQPWTRPCRGEVQLPGSKSLTNRGLILAAMSSGRTRLTGALFSRDSRLLCTCLESLGYGVSANEDSREIIIEGQGGAIPKATADLFVGNAGTAARFLTALVCLHPSGSYHFDGDREMRRRPMSGLLRALESLGACFSFEGEPDCFPFTAHTSGLRGGDWSVNASASSQMLSALMMVAPCVDGDVQLRASGARPAFIKMTARLMSRCGVTLSGRPETGYRIPGRQAYSIPNGVLPIEPDVTAASYFMALPFVVGGRLRICGLTKDMLQGDIAFAEVLKTIGMVCEEDEAGWTVHYKHEPADRPTAYCFNAFSDTFLTFAAIAPLLSGPVMIDGIRHTRFQETDRIAAMSSGLRGCGAEVSDGDSSLLVRPFSDEQEQSVKQAAIQTYRDHRVAMSFAVLGCRSRLPDGKPWLYVVDPSCCAKTFPGFFVELENLYRISHDNRK